jgi:hypothetical protein
VLFAVEDGTSITLINKVKMEKYVIQLPTGSILVFPSTFVHAGSAYNKRHMRVFCYIKYLPVTFHNKSQDWIVLEDLADPEFKRFKSVEVNVDNTRIINASNL